MGPFGGEGGVGGGDRGWGVRARISQYGDLFCSFAMDDHAGIALRRSGWGRSVLGGGCRGVRGRAWGVGWVVAVVCWVYWGFAAFCWDVDLGWGCSVAV